MDDPHYPRYPADDEGRNPIPPCFFLELCIPYSIFTERKDEVEALKEVGDGVAEADEDVEEEDPDDGKGRECLQEWTLVILVWTVAAPVACITFWSNLRKKNNKASKNYF